MSSCGLPSATTSRTHATPDSSQQFFSSSPMFFGSCGVEALAGKTPRHETVEPSARASSQLRFVQELRTTATRTKSSAASAHRPGSASRGPATSRRWKLRARLHHELETHLGQVAKEPLPSPGQCALLSEASLLQASSDELRPKLPSQLDVSGKLGCCRLCLGGPSLLRGGTRPQDPSRLRRG